MIGAARPGSRRLPGITFEKRPPPPLEALPRMDVTAFVGFASAGPLHTPVPIEDPATFADLFGADAVLAWDRARGASQRAQLGPAVRSFFRNGGRRCWVVRVARSSPVDGAPDDWARANRFPVPGLARLSGAGLRPALVDARSEGSWSDDVTVAAAVQILPVSPGRPVVDGAVAAVPLATPGEVSVGDVLRLTWWRGSPAQPAAALLAPVTALDGGVARLGAEQLWLVGPPAPAETRWAAAWFGADEAPLPAGALQDEPVFAVDGTVALQLPPDLPPLEGRFLLLTRGAERVWVVVESTAVSEGAGSPPGRSVRATGRWSQPAFAAPPGLLEDPGATIAGERLRVELWVRQGGGLPRRLGDLGLSPGHPRHLGALPSDRLLFAPDEDLLTPDEDALRDRVRALAGDGLELRQHHGDLWQEAANPRFPLAAGGSRTDAYVPLGLPLVPVNYLGPAPVRGEPLERDGLARFDASLFLDPALRAATAADLAARADFVRWQQPAPRRLQGIHAVLALDEVTLVAVPDATQRGWSVEHAQAPAPLETPRLSADADAQGWHLSWPPVDPGAAYALEQAADPGFSRPTPVALAAGATAYDVPASIPSGTWFRVRAFRRAAASGDYFDVRGAEVAGSFWSDPVQVLVPAPAFRDCPPGALGAPAAAEASPPDAGGTFTLRWGAVPDAVGYEVQQATALDFSGAVTVAAGPATEAVLLGRAPGYYHLRVRASGALAAVSAAAPVGAGAIRFDVTGAASPAHLVTARAPGALGEEVVFDGAAFTERFSGPGNGRAPLADGFRYTVTRSGGWPAGPGLPAFRAWDPAAQGPFGPSVTVTVPAPARRVLVPVEGYAPTREHLVEVQAALLELCAARGDLLAVLALPAHYREEDAVLHAAALRARVETDAPGSHGALYHPWLQVEGADGIAAAPPDGAMCGVMARRAVRGAWLAPANEPLGDALGLTPAVGRDQWGRLRDAQVNLIAQEPHGFVALGADTLAEDPELTPVAVRRLLALLRRAALRLGPTFVFEPNGGVFRRTVDRAFTSMLDDLFRRGALAGGVAAEAFQVVVAASPDDGEQGRFVVELKVAPALPLEFLTVRLVQSGAAGQITEGA